MLLLITALLIGLFLACTSGGGGNMNKEDRSGTQDIGDMEDESFFNVNREAESGRTVLTFEKLDRDGDGRLGWVEFQRGEIDKLQWWEFKKFDRDGDGGLDREEYRKITAYMLRGEKPKGELAE